MAAALRRSNEDPRLTTTIANPRCWHERGKFDLFFIGDMLAAREKDGRVIAQGA